MSDAFIDDLLDSLVEAVIYREQCGVVYRDRAQQLLDEARAAIKEEVTRQKAAS